MRRPFPWLTLGLLLLIAAALFSHLRGRRRVLAPASAMQGEPRLMLWAWETPEDLRKLEVQRAGVAYLSREILLGAANEVQPRRNPLFLPPDAYRMAVVRIETAPGYGWRAAEIPAVAARVAEAAQEPGVRALEVDFDAHSSELLSYAALLRELRRQMPEGMPLSITALTSWCGRGSWLHDVPVDEAVPMFFRMGGPSGLRAIAPRSFSVIEEPRCASSVGVATDERWPEIDARQRVYVFRPGPWTGEELAAVNAQAYGQLEGVAFNEKGPRP